MNKRQKTYFLGGFWGVGGTLIEISKNLKIVFHCDYFPMCPESFSSLALQIKKLAIRIARMTNRNPAHKTPKGVNIRIKKKPEKKEKAVKRLIVALRAGAAIQRPPGGVLGSLYHGPQTSRHTHTYLVSPLHLKNDTRG